MLLSDVEQLLRYALAFPWWLMIPALGLRAVNWALRFVKWHFYLRLVGVRSLSVPDSAAVFLTGFPLAISPGKVAEVLKSFILFNMTGAPVMATLPVVAAERFSDGLAVLLLVALSIANLAANEYWPIVIICLGLLGGGILLLQIRPLCLAVLRWLSRAPLVGRFAHSFELFYESSYRIVLLPNLVIASGLGFVANLLDGVGVYLILVGLGLPASATTFYQALLVISLSVVAGSLSGMPGAIGAADLTITGTLQKLVGLQCAASRVRDAAHPVCAALVRRAGRRGGGVRLPAAFVPGQPRGGHPRARGRAAAACSRARHEHWRLRQHTRGKSK